MNKRVEKIKTHLQDNKAVYISAVVGVAVGGGAVAAVGYNKMHVAQKAIVLGIGNTVTLEQTTVLVRRGHPGNIIKCNETGELFASQNRAAEVLGVSQSLISRHLNGHLSNAGGYTLENLGEAQ